MLMGTVNGAAVRVQFTEQAMGGQQGERLAGLRGVRQGTLGGLASGCQIAHSAVK